MIWNDSSRGLAVDQKEPEPLETGRLREPFLLTPAEKDYLWGGSRLRDSYGKGNDVRVDYTVPLAETWECSAHPDGSSIIASGKQKGKSLREVLRWNPELLGLHPRVRGELPILVKFIDAASDLSIQVHPDDEYARTREGGQMGKTELWYVLQADKGAEIVYGFQRDVTREEVEKAAIAGSIGRLLQRIPVKKNDVFLVESGTIHAIGKGIVLAEIQQNSNLTYRLYDYDRIGRSGKRRELHLEKALDVLNYQSSAAPRQPMRVLNYHNGFALELLGRCRYFQVERMLLNTERCRSFASVQTGSNSFQVLLCISGCGVIFWENGMLNLFKGDCVFVPADSVPLKLHGRAELLKIGC